MWVNNAHLQQVGKTMHALLQDLKSVYAAETAYQVLERIFAENYHLVENEAHTKDNADLSSSCLQSVDDLESTYRTKGTGDYKGYVANLIETCDPQNEIQLITKVQVAPNNVDDAQLLAEALPDLQARTNIETLVTDGGFGGAASDAALQEAETVTLIQTAIRGVQPNPNKFSLSDFVIEQNEQHQPARTTCPQGKRSRSSRMHHRLASALRPVSVLHLSIPVGWTLPHPTVKARPALPLDFYDA